MGTREGTEMNEKGELVVRQTGAGRSPINLVPVNAEIVPTPGSHDDARTFPIPESHIDAGTILIPESRIKTRTVRVHTSMPTEVQTPQRGDGPTMPLWML